MYVRADRFDLDLGRLMPGLCALFAHNSSADLFCRTWTVNYNPHTHIYDGYTIIIMEYSYLVYVYIRIHTFGPSGTHTHTHTPVRRHPHPSDTIYANELHASSSSSSSSSPIDRPRFNGCSCTAPVSDVRYIHIFV